MDKLSYISRLNLILENISTAFKASNKYLEGTWRKPLHAINVLGSNVFYYSKQVPVGNGFPEFIHASYDVLPLLVLESALVRGIRYSGKKSFTRDLYTISQLDPGMDRHSYFPTFITRGHIEVADLSPEFFREKMAVLYMLIHQLKPFVMINKYESKRVTLVFPSPLTGMEVRVDNKTCILAPAFALIQISFDRAQERRGSIFCYPISYEYILAAARLFVISKKNTHYYLDITDPLPIVIPQEVLENEKILLEAYENRGSLIIPGLFVIETDVGYVASYNNRKLCRSDVRRLVLLSIEQYIADYSLITIFEKAKQVSLGSLKGPIFRRDSRQIPLFLSLSRKYVSNIERRLFILARDFKIGGSIVQVRNFIKNNGDNLTLLSPPIAVLSTFHKINLDDLEKRLSNNIMLPSDTSLNIVFSYVNAIFAWWEAIERYRMIMTNYGLYMPL